MKILSKLADCHNRPKDAASSWKVSSTHKVNIKNIEFWMFYIFEDLWYIYYHVYSVTMVTIIIFIENK